ncbi:MAG: hypothetical protein IH820_03600 [Bacteroidetes bacterium]|nr:hypothetical protein [Bacteroidota bacterium]
MNHKKAFTSVDDSLQSRHLMEELVVPTHVRFEGISMKKSICFGVLLAIVPFGAVAQQSATVIVEPSRSLQGMSSFWSGIVDLPKDGRWTSEEAAQHVDAVCAHADLLEQKVDAITSQVREAGSDMARGVDRGSNAQVMEGMSRLAPPTINLREKARDAGYARALCDQLQVIVRPPFDS